MARISIFTGREARLNKAIFWILARQSPLTIYNIWQKLRDQRDFAYIRYHIVNRRVRALERQDYVEESGKKKTKTGFTATLYQLTIRTYLAILLEQIDLDNFIEKAPNASILGVIESIISSR